MSDATAAALEARCRALLGRHLHRYWYRVTQAAGSVGGLFVTLDEAAASLEDRPPPQLGDADRATARVEAARARPTPALDRLAETFGLSSDAAELLGVLSALQASAELLRLATFAWADFAVKQPTAGFMAELCADDVEHRDRLLEALTVRAPLRAAGLLRLGDAPRWTPPGPVVSRPIAAAAAVGRALRGHPPLGEDRPVGIAGPTPSAPLDAIVGPDLVLRAAVTHARAGGPAALLIGAQGTGRRTRAVAGLTGAWVVDDDQRLALDAPATALTAGLRDARLAGAPVVVLRLDRPRTPTQLARLLEVLPAFATLPLVLTTTPEAAGPLSAALPRARVVELAPPDALPGRACTPG